MTIVVTIVLSIIGLLYLIAPQPQHRYAGKVFLGFAGIVLLTDICLSLHKIIALLDIISKR